MLAVSIDTLRNWDQQGILKSFRPTKTSKRLYKIEDIQKFLNKSQSNGGNNTVDIAREWVESKKPVEAAKEYYCQTRDIFNARVIRISKEAMNNSIPKNLADLLTAIMGEVGNNSYDHNIGKWKDVPGTFFAHDLNNKKIVLADRGQGILSTLKKVRPSLKNDEEAVYTAFTEKLSGRAPESRGNGLKFVRSAIEHNALSIEFSSGNAKLYIEKKNKEMIIKQNENNIDGCIAIISY